MSNIIKKKYRTARNEFKNELFSKCKDNKALAMLMIQTYTAWHHRRHITKTWAMFRNPEYDAFVKAYNKELFGKHLSGRDDVWRSLYFADKELHDKYHRRIPERYAMGDTLAVAYQALRS